MKTPAPERVVKFATFWRIFWDVNFPLFVGLYLVTDEKLLLLYLGLVSIYANRESAAAKLEAARGRKENQSGG